MDNVASALMLVHSSASNFESMAKEPILVANVAHVESQIQVISPIRKLPAELSVEIFLIVVEVGTPWNESPLRTSTSPALRKVLAISQVCAHWRQLACTTPQLWRFPVKLNLKKVRSDSFLATTKTFLERSAPHPIPILLVDQTSVTSPVANLLFEFTSRWKSLVFHNAQISRLRKLPMDALKSLVSVDIKDRTDLSTQSPVKVFLGAPRLRTVSVAVLKFTDRIHLPWSQLTRLKIDCTNIVTADFSRLIPWSQRPISSAPVVQLARLESLSLFYALEEEEGHITPFFAPLALPSLIALDIRSGIETSWSSADFTSFQSRSTNIERLEIGGSMMTPENIVSLLTNSTNLVDLTLDNCFDGFGAARVTMASLQYSSTQNVHVVPRLQKVSIAVRFGFDEKVLERMIFSRWWTDAQLAALPILPPVARWQKVTIDSADDAEGEGQNYGEQFVAKAAQLTEEGLDIALHW
ncbi:hypothetical protein FB45DRAFT_1053332 [Roridomyces roridus]|uniref:F-box domain-containing protein n=1 Tax=Roridomyces roridus TaxID=1738132 RepID=A0AAD7CC39_9AGAR|nr:hypothetical protein FB45DRAFT_1053332 [Roridomyces roridus]